MGELNEVQIDVVKEYSEEVFSGVKNLVAQLDDQFSPLSEDEMKEIISSPSTHLILATDNVTSDILGMATLVTYRIPYKYKGWLEDVVVDKKQRSKGIGSALLEKCIDEARSLGIKTLDLTSRPERESANNLYIRLGFEKRETNVYRLNLK